MTFSHRPTQVSISHSRATGSQHYARLDEAEFRRIVLREGRRTTRSRRPSLLMLFGLEGVNSERRASCLGNFLLTLPGITRETDFSGWYTKGTVVGVMFTEITFDEEGSIPSTLMARINQTIERHLSTRELPQLSLQFHFLGGEPKNRASEMPDSYLPIYGGVPVHAQSAESAR